MLSFQKTSALQTTYREPIRNTTAATTTAVKTFRSFFAAKPPSIQTPQRMKSTIISTIPTKPSPIMSGIALRTRRRKTLRRYAFENLELRVMIFPPSSNSVSVRLPIKTAHPKPRGGGNPWDWAASSRPSVTITS